VALGRDALAFSAILSAPFGDPLCQGPGFFDFCFDTLDLRFQALHRGMRALIFMVFIDGQTDRKITF